MLQAEYTASHGKRRTYDKIYCKKTSSADSGSDRNHFLSFAMMRLAGGDAVTYMYENAGAAVSQEVIDETRKEYGLDSAVSCPVCEMVHRNGNRRYGNELCIKKRCL